MEQTIRRFLAACRKPLLVEPGEEPILLEEDRYSIESRGDGCILHAWNESGNLVRRVTTIVREKPGRIELRGRRFGSGEVVLALVDAARKSNSLELKSGPAQFREALRRMLARDFPDWTIEQITSAPDLERSLSGLYARGWIAQGQARWAFIGASARAGSAACDQILTFGLIWLDETRRRAKKKAVAGLHIFLPHGHTRTTANRLAFLRRDRWQFRLHEYDAKNHLATIDERDLGNLHTELLPCRALSEPTDPATGWIAQLRKLPGVEAVAGQDGLLSLRVRGLGFARAGGGVLTSGLERQIPVTAPRFEQVVLLARELARFRSPDAADRLNPLYRKYPESWLESMVRRNLRTIDSTLREPLYTHPLSIAGADRGIIDLLASDRRGRLVILELKATEDIHLPLQGLDYWMRVQWHLERGEFQSRGYFPGIELSHESPRLLLVSPAVEFHPTTETLLRYFPPELMVERVGATEDWRRELRVVFRKQGSARLA